jgi:hypothetical protein
MAIVLGYVSSRAAYHRRELLALVLAGKNREEVTARSDVPPFKLLHRIAMEESNMQAAVVPAVSGSWEVKDVPQPQPGPNQVLVKMHASGICYTDVHETLGHLPGQFPRILGHEPVGEIVAIAPDVAAESRGSRGHRMDSIHVRAL